VTPQSRQAFVATLTGDATLTALLATDTAATPATGPAIFLFNRQPPPVYPCVVYQFSSSVPDPAFVPTNVEGGGEGKIAEGRAEVRVYSKGPVAARDTIVARLRTLLQGRVLTLAGWTGRLFRVEILQELPDQYSDAANAYYHLLRFRLRETQ
jgi:hypothetical protein